jgi:hypothetical protein
MNQAVGTAEDKRAAATIATSLSGYVMAGALAIIGAEAAIFVFLLDGKQITIGLTLSLGLTFCVLFYSCILGAQGIWKIYRDGFKGTWNIVVGGKFSRQFFLSMVGILLLIFSCFLANRAEEKPKQEAAIQAQTLIQRLAVVDSLPEMNSRLDRIERTMDELKACRMEVCPATTKQPQKKK